MHWLVWDSSCVVSWTFCAWRYIHILQDGQNPPEWPLTVLSKLCNYVRGSNNIIDDGHKMLWPMPICDSQPESLIKAFFFVDDIELPRCASPYGSWKFLQVVCRKWTLCGERVEVNASLSISPARCVSLPPLECRWDVPCRKESGPTCGHREGSWTS